jgi:hypothetical protein
LSQYRDKEHDGYWWLHYSGQLRYAGNCHGIPPEDYFYYAPVVQWWNVRCELDYYRMLKEYNVLREGPLELEDK